MAGSVDPGTQRRRLGRELRPLREHRELTQGEVAKKLEWSLTKIIRIEKGGVSVSATDLAALLALYGETNHKKVTRLADLARSGHGQSWSDQYRDLISGAYAQYLSLEGSAAALQIFHPYLVPGLLQTMEYAAALADGNLKSAQSQRMVELRMQRQNWLFGESGGTDQDELTQLTFLLSEEALHRWIGGPAVMAAQIQHVLDMAERPNVRVAVIPYSAGVHPGLLGPSILIHLPDDERAVFNENRDGGLLTEGDSATITDAVEQFGTMEELTLPPAETVEMLREKIRFFDDQSSRGTAASSAAAARYTRR